MVPSNRNSTNTSVLLHLTEDLLFKILCRCDVPTLLHCEQTCRALRDAVQTKQLWSEKLSDLDPDSPPLLGLGTTANALSYEELRKCVVNAVRWRKRVDDGRLQYRFHQRVKLSDAPIEQGSVFSRGMKKDTSIKLTNDGRFMFVIWTDLSNHDFLRIYDLQSDDPDTCVWEFKAQMMVSTFAFRYDTGNKLIVAVADMMQEEAPRRLQIFELTLSGPTLAPRQLLQKTCQKNWPGNFDTISLTEDFMVYRTEIYLIVAAWRQGPNSSEMLFLNGHREGDCLIESIALSGRYLFVTETIDTTPRDMKPTFSYELHALDLHDAFKNNARDSALPFRKRALCTFVTQPPSPFGRSLWAFAQPSVSDFKWRDPTDTRIRLIFCAPFEPLNAVYERQYEFAMYSIVFDAGDGSTKPTMSWDIGPKYVELSNKKKYICSHPGSFVSQNGACLINSREPARTFGNEPGVAYEKEHCVLALNREGRPKFVKVPTQISEYLARQCTPDKWTVFMDPTSNALLCHHRFSHASKKTKKKRKDKGECIDIYLPC